jgi:hypothetical protein
MHVTIRGKRWNLVFEKVAGKNIGFCEHPDKKNKRIVIHDKLCEKETLRVIAHEIMHAAYWDLDEEAIDTATTDLARILWKLGYRRQE